MIGEQHCDGIGRLLALANDDRRVRPRCQPVEPIERARLRETEPTPFAPVFRVHGVDQRADFLAAAGEVEAAHDAEQPPKAIEVAPLLRRRAELGVLRRRRWRVIGRRQERRPLRRRRPRRLAAGFHRSEHALFGHVASIPSACARRRAASGCDRSLR